MIKADNIIEESEIRAMKRLMSEYSITHQEISDTRMIRFSDAVNTLKELSIKERGHEKYRILFSYNGTQYDFPLTDTLVLEPGIVDKKILAICI